MPACVCVCVCGIKGHHCSVYSVFGTDRVGVCVYMCVCVHVSVCVCLSVCVCVC